MSNDQLAQLLGRSDTCVTPCNDQGTPIPDAEECFGYSGTNIEEPNCDEWRFGFRDCEDIPTPNLIGKINWMFNRFSCAIKDAVLRICGLEDRVTALEGLRRLVDLTFDENTGVITEIYSDGSNEPNAYNTDTDTSATNFTISAPDNAGNQTISFDIVDLDGNVVRTETQTIAGAPPTVDTNTFITSFNGNSTGGLVTPDANNRIVVQRSNGTQWQLQLPVTTAAFTCMAAQIRPLNGNGNSFGRSNFNFVALGPTSVQANTGGANPFIVTVAGVNGGISVLPETINRFRLGATGSATITMTFNQDIRSLTLNFQDIDVPLENATNFNPSETSITPPFGQNTLSDVLIENINGNTVTFTYSNTGGFSTVIFINNVTLAPPCFAAQRCVNGNGDVEFRDTNGNVLAGQFEVC